MCTTCNYKLYEKNPDVNNVVEKSLGYESLVIRCNENGKNYKMAVKGEPKSDIVIYRCPTCGKELF